ncbi:MAG TPA: CmcJ/NvfI family oxidoreductase [Caulobacteraceae bacterium]|nr:CmcJ/NvfI family oxidoreductase [Caulobacteraceae bacterium]
MSETLTRVGGADAEIVEARLNYSVDIGRKPVSESGGPDGLLRRHVGRFEGHAVRITNGRPLSAGFSLDANGFELAEQPTAMADFFDPEALRATYYPEVSRLIADRCGARRVHVFDHTLRSGDEAERAARKIREPVRAVHNDYTEWSAPQRVRDLLPEEAEALISRRFAIVQVWRAIGEPIARDPLAIADARSLDPGDFIAAERRFPDRVGEIYMFAYNPAHRWFWFPRMSRDEALVFKVYDSARDGRARWSAHTSFEHPATPASAPARQSIEIRAFAFF